MHQTIMTRGTEKSCQIKKLTKSYALHPPQLDYVFHCYRRVWSLAVPRGQPFSRNARIAAKRTFKTLVQLRLWFQFLLSSYHVIVILGTWYYLSAFGLKKVCLTWKNTISQWYVARLYSISCNTAVRATSNS